MSSNSRDGGLVGFERTRAVSARFHLQVIYVQVHNRQLGIYSLYENWVELVKRIVSYRTG